MPSTYSQQDFNQASGQSAQNILKSLAVFSGEAIKAIATTIKHLLYTFLGK
jgi:hypothetical protein